MKEHNDFRTSAELPCELREDNWDHIADFVEEDAHAAYFRNHSTAEGGREFDFSGR